jgi:hypothetical protein
MRSLFFFLASYNVILKGEHLPGVDNREADALSRDDDTTFLAQVPTAHPTRSPIPQELIEALVIQQPDWISDTWTELLKSILARD